MKATLASARPEAAWREVAERVDAWLDARGAVRRDAVVLVPFASLLPHARRAFAARARWMPRIETTATLAASLGPAATAAGERSFGHALESALVGAHASRAPWAADWAARDPRSFWRTAAQSARAARAIEAGLASAHPAARPARIAAVRAALPPASGPDDRERAFATLAVEWALRSAAADTDSLWSVAASAVVAVEAGGEDALVAALLAHAKAEGVPTLVLSADPTDGTAPFAGVDAADVHLAELDDFEDEAEATAAAVLEHLRRGERPVALVAQDRELVRRVRALLARQAVVVRDETGWKLSTTRAGATVVGLLRALDDSAGSDAVVDWAKSLPAPRRADASDLEAALRKAGTRAAGAIDRQALGPGADRLRALWHAVRDTFAGPDGRPLPDWLDALRTGLDRAGQLAPLEADAAGRQTLGALRLLPPLGAEERRAALEIGLLDRAAFARLVDEVLEEATFLPPKPQRRAADSRPAAAEATTPLPAVASSPTGPAARRRKVDASQLAFAFGVGPEATAPPAPEPAAAAGAEPVERADEEVDVVVAPLARLLLRPFAAAVLGGADASHLGAPPSADPLLPEAVGKAAGIAGAEARRQRERLAFAHLLRLPRTTLLRRRTDGVEVPGESAFVTELAVALERGGAALAPWHDPRGSARVVPVPTERPAPVVPAGRLPRRVSASAVATLRACPYQFHARRVLLADEVSELAGELGKREYGSWLHAVLHRFHSERGDRPGAAAVEADETALQAAADAVQAEHGIDAPSLSPYRATFADLVPAYVRWLHAWERGGARWSTGEVPHEVALAGIDDLVLTGTVDRIDVRRGPGGEALDLLDYKTGNADKLEKQADDPDEDTQLAAYAALVAAVDPRPIRAYYLPLDQPTKGVREREHAGVAESALALVEDLVDVFGRLRGGAPLAAIGEGDACRWCPAGGLCRKVHWPEPDGGDDDADAAAALLPDGDDEAAT